MIRGSVRFPALLLAVLIFSGVVRGEVFTLWPFRGGISATSPLAGLPISESPLYRETLTVNGVNAELEIFSTDLKWDELVSAAATVFPSGSITVGTDYLRGAVKLPDGNIERVLFARGTPGHPVAVFRIVAPEKIPPPTEWPPELPPLPPGAAMEQVIRFPRRNAVTGAFSNIGAAPQSALRELSVRLRAAGFTPVGNEGHSAAGKGDLFIRSQPRESLWIQFGANGGIFHLKRR